MKEIEENLSRERETGGLIDDDAQQGALDTIINRLEKAARSNQEL